MTARRTVYVVLDPSGAVASQWVRLDEARFHAKLAGEGFTFEARKL